MAQVVHLTHDDGTFSEYDTAPNSRLLVTVGAALNGTAYGVEKNRTGTAGDGNLNPINLSGATSEIRLGFYFDLNTISLTPTTETTLMSFQGGGAGENFFIRLRDEGSGDFIRVVTQDDDGFEIDTDTSGGGLPGSEMTVEIVWTKASSTIANDGICQILINDVQAAIISNIDFFNSFAGLANATTIFNISSGIWTGSGVLYYDEIIIRDDTTPIFPSDFSGYALVIGGGQP